jgi:hypothetical protein
VHFRKEVRLLALWNQKICSSKLNRKGKMVIGAVNIGILSSRDHTTDCLVLFLKKEQPSKVHPSKVTLPPVMDRHRAGGGIFS